MNQLKNNVKQQVMYLGRWVGKEHFRAFVYRENEQKLAESYEEFESLLATGTWFDSKENIKSDSQKIRKSKHGDAKPKC